MYYVEVNVCLLHTQTILCPIKASIHVHVMIILEVGFSFARFQYLDQIVFSLFPIFMNYSALVRLV